jgi:hypothetical protein
MAETRPGEEIERGLEHDADELDERIDKLGDHIEDARRKAQPRAEEAAPIEDAAGDWEDTEPVDSTGEDASGFDDPEADDADEDDDEDLGDDEDDDER